MLSLLGMTEVRTSWLQSRVFAAMARRMTYKVEPGQTSRVAVSPGPYDTRLGYALLDGLEGKLSTSGFRIDAQARTSPWMQKLSWFGVFPTYREKQQAGLEIFDAAGRPLYQTKYPNRVYPEFESVPALVVHSLLFVENREILDTTTPYRNPAVEWDRLLKAFVDQGKKPFSGGGTSGGSTLATQLEKIRHSPEGRTSSIVDKFRQMLSASLRAYQDGEKTLGVRRQITRDYLNSLPLSSLPGYGEVHGLGDGLWAWFDADFDEVNHLLSLNEADIHSIQVERKRAMAFRQILSLLLAVNRPSHHLQKDRPSLHNRVDSYLRMLAEAGAISPRLRDLALSQRPSLRDHAPDTVVASFADRKATDSIRAGLLNLLGVESTYQLDRLDLRVQTTIDAKASQDATQLLKKLTDQEYAASAGIVGKQMIEDGPADSVIYSFNLYEVGEGTNFLRVQADNYDKPLNINQGTRIELGSTSKLRTLATYLELIAEIHARYSKMSAEELAKVEPREDDGLTKWVVDTLREPGDHSLPGILEAAMSREYSAVPWEPFFTGGGLHYFANFNKDDNGKLKLPLRQAFRNSTNLVFIRVMRDIVHYFYYSRPGLSPEILENPEHPLRADYLKRFVDKESRDFITKYYNKYKGKSVDESLGLLARKMRPTPYRLAVAYRSVNPDGGLDGLLEFLESRLPEEALAKVDVESLYRKYGPEHFDLGDRGYLARVHPLELWLLEFLNQRPDAELEEVLDRSKEVRQDVYRWLYKPRHRHAQNLRIRILLEVDAFTEIHKIWKRHGYPFPSLTPSYASAIGSSGDNPAALAELAGIIQNGGIRYPTTRVQRLHFARGTPMETAFGTKPAEPERVMPAAVAAVLRQEMMGVVEFGTARRAFESIRKPDGVFWSVGGKTGTGDNRLDSYDSNGWLIRSKVMSRTAAFVFLIGDRFYGTVIAYVPGQKAAAHSFTSALAVQIFRKLTPTFEPILAREREGSANNRLAHAVPDSGQVPQLELIRPAAHQ
ncbi:MAG: transglycosylase domain-containing protein [Bryobacteraceae bacterium]